MNFPVKGTRKEQDVTEHVMKSFPGFYSQIDHITQPKVRRFVQGSVAPNFLPLETLTKVWGIPHSGYRFGQNALAENDLYKPCKTQEVLR